MKTIGRFALSLPILMSLTVAAFAQQTPQTPETPRTRESFVFITGGNFLGIRTEDVTRENMGRYNMSETRGAAVTEVVADSPAARAGLRQGDVIVRFDDENVTSARKLSRLIQEAAPGQSVRLTVRRGGSEQQLSATLDDRRDQTRQATAADRARIESLLGNMRGMDGNTQVFSTMFGNRRRVGVSTTYLTSQLAQYFGVSSGRGALITEVTENSPAARAGLRAGDVITEVDGERIDDASDLSRLINRREEGELSLTVIRERSSRTIRVTPERREPSGVTPAIAPIIRTIPSITRLVAPRAMVAPAPVARPAVWRTSPSPII